MVLSVHVLWVCMLPLVVVWVWGLPWTLPLWPVLDSNSQLLDGGAVVGEECASRVTASRGRAVI